MQTTQGDSLQAGVAECSVTENEEANVSAGDSKTCKHQRN
jgi:hypothetical protein